jgi:hypothetical protein
MFDNSGPRPRLIGKKQGGMVTIDTDAPTALRQALGLGSESGKS